jgi:hypothetical protein
MKNKNLMLLLGIGVAYYLYKMYANKSTSVIKTPVPPNVLYPITENINTITIPNQFLVDKVPTAEVSYQPSTYQTYYVSMAGNNYKVPSTC